MPEMAQFMLSVPYLTRDRMDALRIVLDTSRASIGRLAIESGGLAQLEEEHSERLARLHEVARKRRYPNWNAMVQALIAESAKGNNARRGQKLPTLEELETKSYPFPAVPAPRRRERGSKASVASVPATPGEDSAPVATFSG